MAYIGTKPTVGNFQICDAISVVNNQAAYTMQVGSVNVTPQSANHMIVSLNGTIQKPNSSFTVSGSTITFASNLVTNDVIDFIQILGDVLDLGVPSDATVTAAKLGANSVTSAKLNNDIISGTTELASEPADTDEFLVSDAGTLKRIDYSLIKASGGMTLLNSGSVSSTTSQLSFNTTYVTTTHRHYRLLMSGKVTTDNTGIRMRFKNEAGTSAITSPYSYNVTDIGNSSSETQQSSVDRIEITNQNYLGNAANEGFNLILDFMSPLSNTVPTMAEWQIGGANNSDAFKYQIGAARRNDGTEKHGGFLLYMTSGDFAEYTYEFYGYNK